MKNQNFDELDKGGRGTQLGLKIYLCFNHTKTIPYIRNLQTVFVLLCIWNRFSVIETKEGGLGLKIYLTHQIFDSSYTIIILYS